MNLIRIAVLCIVAIMIVSLDTLSFNRSINRSHANSSRHITTYGDMPSAYKVKILFANDNYEHIHTLNEGNFLINVIVNGSPQFLSTGDLKQIHGDFHCNVSSAKRLMHGEIDIQRTTTVFGDKDEDELVEILRKDIIDGIIKQIEKI